MAKRRKPKVVLIAGPNGAGKSTLAPMLLRDTLRVSDFVNADVIAHGLSAFASAEQAFAAGRIMLDRLHELAKSRIDFAFESTLSGRTFATWLAGLVEKDGYSFHLLFVWLSNADIAVARVQARARLGGHDIPEEVIRRRYDRAARNFFELYAPLARTWRFYDNSGAKRTLLASGGIGREERARDAKRGKKSKPRSLKKKAEARPDIDRIFDEGVEIDRAFDRAIREALRMHKRAGNPVPIWKNNRVVWIPPEEIPV